MAADEMATDQLSSDGADDDALLLYLYEKSSDRAKCYDCVSMGGLTPMTRNGSDVVADGDRELLSRSTDQICSKSLSLVDPNAAAIAQVPGVVRTCRSQENYFELSDMICVDIDIDENLASSVDALHYRESVVPRTSDSSGSLEAVELESGDQVPPATTPEDRNKSNEMAEEVSREEDLNTSRSSSSFYMSTNLSEAEVDAVEVDEQDGRKEDHETRCVDDELHGGRSGTCLKDADRPSAARLAKRLFYLDGFRKTDVSPHLSKKNSFSQLVGEEFLKYFNFTEERLDVGLRRFLRHVTVSGDSQECDRLLGHFSRRYHQCNPIVHQSEDCCHTLVCAMLLLNANLNGQKNCGQRRMTQSEFITNLSHLNNGQDFPTDVLTSVYISIENQPLSYDTGDDVETPTANQQLSSTEGLTSSSSSSNRVPSPLATNAHSSSSSSSSSQSPCRPQAMKQISAIAAFKKGYIMRKCCVEPDGKKTPLGKRCWKMYYMVLRDTALYLYTDENCYKRSTLCSNTTQLQHALAAKASDYTKKKHVFRLQTADLAQYLIQTSDVRECDDWTEAINLIAAFYSPPVFRDDVPANSTYRRCFRRSITPVSNTPLNLREQIGQHELMVSRYERELSELRKNPPDRTVHARQLQDCSKLESYVKFELKRYKTYVRLLRVKTAAALLETDAKPPSTLIGQLDGEHLPGNPVTSSSGSSTR